MMQNGNAATLAGEHGGNQNKAISQAQKWTSKMVAARLEEAAMTMRTLQVQGVKPMRYGSAWPDVIHDPNEAFGWNDAEFRPGPPTAQAITRMDEALQWLRWLEPDQVRLVWLHADQVPRKTIMAKLGLSRTKAWRLWAAAIMTITTSLNIGKLQVVSEWHESS